jgi:uridylate kinase
MADNWGIGRAEADSIGMLGTVMNALMLRGALTALSDLDVRVMTAVPMDTVAEPFIRLRAIRHLERGALVLLAGGIGQPYVTTDYPAVLRRSSWPLRLVRLDAGDPGQTGNAPMFPHLMASSSVGVNASLHGSSWFDSQSCQVPRRSRGRYRCGLVIMTGLDLGVWGGELGWSRTSREP